MDECIADSEKQFESNVSNIIYRIYSKIYWIKYLIKIDWEVVTQDHLDTLLLMSVEKDKIKKMLGVNL